MRCPLPLCDCCCAGLALQLWSTTSYAIDPDVAGDKHLPSPCVERSARRAPCGQLSILPFLLQFCICRIAYCIPPTTFLLQLCMQNLRWHGSTSLTAMHIHCRLQTQVGTGSALTSCISAQKYTEVETGAAIIRSRSRFKCRIQVFAR